ncbi:MAG: ABC transporter permease, partial [Calditrichia bacterium]|nr:ABC transporter permease [Calditrichia bacterium]
VSVFSVYNSIVTYKDNKKFEFNIKYTDSEFWHILDFNFIEGKPFSKEDVENGNQVAVISKETRKQYFNDENAVGKTIEADGKNFRVIGVVDNVSRLRLLPFSDLWMPITTTKDDITKPSLASSGVGYGAFILARSSSDFPIIKEEFQKHLSMVEFPDDRFNSIKASADTYLETISRIMFRDYNNSHTGSTLMIVFVLMFLFMLLPTINLVNINVSRIRERASEIGIRKSFGASSMTLVGQFIVENIIITFIGGIISLILAIIVLSIINGSGFIPHVQLGLNFRIFTISFFVMLFFGLLSGVYPAFKMSRLKPVDALKGGQV